MFSSVPCFMHAHKPRLPSPRFGVVALSLSQNRCRDEASVTIDLLSEGFWPVLALQNGLADGAPVRAAWALCPKPPPTVHTKLRTFNSFDP